MTDIQKPQRSMIHWVEPPELGQALEELEWVNIDVFEDGRVSISACPPTPEQVATIIGEFRPYFRTDKTNLSLPSSTA